MRYGDFLPRNKNLVSMVLYLWCNFLWHSQVATSDIWRMVRFSEVHVEVFRMITNLVFDDIVLMTQFSTAY